VPGGRVVDHYRASFDRIWADARPVTDVARHSPRSTNGAGDMARRDYIDDPKAPKANGVASVMACVVNDAHEILLIHRADNGLLWARCSAGDTT